MAYTTGTLTGTYQHFNGDPAEGVVEIIPNSKSLIDSEGNVILTGRVKVTLDETGSFSVTLPATDDATVEPATDRQYTVVAKLRHQHLPAVSGIELPTGETRDMADLTTAEEATASLSVWLTQEDYEALETTVAGKADTAYVDAAVGAIVVPDSPDDIGAEVAGAAAALDATLATVAKTGAASDLTGTDAVTAALVNNTASATSSALTATYARHSQTGQPVAIPDIGAFRLTGMPSDELTVPTYDGSGVAVHPSVLYFPEAWNGHRYWMAMTPYNGSDSELENPSIVVSEDGYTWEVPAGLTNPIVPSPAGVAYNSDPAITMGPDGRMWMVYRDFNAEPDRDRLYVLSTVDGVTWTAPTMISDLDALVQRIVSPAMWYDPGTEQWVILGVDIVPTTSTIVRMTAPEATGPWTAATIAAVTPAFTVEPWHIDARRIGDTIVALVQDGSSAGGDLYLMASRDGGQTFTRSTIRHSGGGMYKPAFVPVVTPSGFALDVYTSKLDGEMRRVLARTDHTANVMAAALRQSPYVLGDTYARANSTTALGTATSGQAYTVWAGTPGIIDGQGYAAVAGNTKAAVNVGISDGVFSMEVPAKGAQAWLLFRGAGSVDYWRFGMQAAGWQLQKVVSGAATTVVQGAGGFAAGDRVSVVCDGNTITALINGAPIGSVTDATLNTGTFVGWQLTDSTGRVKNLTARSL